MRRLAPLVALLLALVLVTGCGGGDDEGGGSETGCEDVDAPEAREPGRNEVPTEPLDTATTWALVFDTTCGEFTVTLDLESAPNTTASLVALARDGYFDDTIFHRIIPEFVIQGGDPTQTGSGGPGYQTVDAPSQDTQYVEGLVAMAKTELEPPGTSGSQFFVVTGPDAGTLTPDYAVVGEVTDGLDVVERIGEFGSEDGTPTVPIVVRGVTVSETPTG